MLGREPSKTPVACANSVGGKLSSDQALLEPLLKNSQAIPNFRTKGKMILLQYLWAQNVQEKMVCHLDGDTSHFAVLASDS